MRLDLSFSLKFCSVSHTYSPAQLQRNEDEAPDSQEFERLKEHFEPILRASSGSSSTLTSTTPQHIHSSSITAAASAALAREIPGVSKYNPLSRSRAGKDKSVNKDEMPNYKARLDAIGTDSAGAGGGTHDVEYMRHIENVTEVATLEQRWVNSWTTSLQTRCVTPDASYPKLNAP